MAEYCNPNISINYTGDSESHCIVTVTGGQSSGCSICCEAFPSFHPAFCGSVGDYSCSNGQVTYTVDGGDGCSVTGGDYTGCTGSDPSECPLGFDNIYWSNSSTTINVTYTSYSETCVDESACNYGLLEECTFPTTGDINLDCEMNVVDIVNMVEMVLQDTPQTEQQIMMGDINQDGMVNVVDIVMLVSMIIGLLFK